MRGKNLLWTSLLTALIITTSIGIAIAPTATKVSVDPGNFGNVTAGTYLVADIRVDDVTGLSGFEVKLEWDPFVLKVETPFDVVEGPFLSGLGPTLWNVALSVFGESVRFGSALMVPVTASGSGVLATVTFKVVGAGSTAITLAETDLRDINVQPIDHNTFGGKVSVHIGCEVGTIYPDEHVWIISVEGAQPGINTLYADVTNHGTIDANATVDFKGFDTAGMIRHYATNTAVVPAGGTVTLQSSDFNATELGPGVYRLTARCYWGYGVEGKTDFYGMKEKPLKIQVRE